MEMSRLVTDYRRPRTLGELEALLADPPRGARLMAGGTDLIVRLRAGREGGGPLCLLSLGAIDELARVRSLPDGSLELGAALSLAALAADPLLESRPSLREAAHSVAGPSIRNRATLGGNVCNASPSADLSVALLAASAEFLARAPGGIARRIPVADFFRGPGRTALGPAEYLHSVRLPPAAPASFTWFRKLGLRTVMEIAIVNLAIELELDASGACGAARIALGAVAPTVIRAREAEESLRGAPLGGATGNGEGWEQALVEAARLASQAASPISDQRASASYRKEMVEVLVAEGLRALGARARAAAAAQGFRTVRG